jgi:cytochrome c oxidase cbb3-type subunit III
VTWRIVPVFGLLLMCFGVTGSAVCQNPNSEQSFRGKSIFESKCATCHGLDGLGGEHAPDIARRPVVKALSDQALLDIIHDGLLDEGMPGFPKMAKEDAQSVVDYLHVLQGKSARSITQGDPDRGKDLFFGKAGCSACHQIGSPGQFSAGDLAGFARDHQSAGIRDAILRPAGGPQEAATAVARDGRKFSGTIRNEDNASLQLQGEDGEFYLLMKSSLVSVERKVGDPMPADYGKRLSSAELDDLVSYIQHETHSGKNKDRDRNDKDEEPHAQD